MVQVLLGFQGCQVSAQPSHTHTHICSIYATQCCNYPLIFSVKVLRETQVFQAPLEVLDSPVQKERVASPASLVLQAPTALLDLQDWLCRAPKDSMDPQDHQEEQVSNSI